MVKLKSKPNELILEFDKELKKAKVVWPVRFAAYVMTFSYHSPVS